MAKKQLLIFALEYFGQHTVQGTALAKRPTQVAESFIDNGWDVVFVHRDGRDECGEKPFVVKNEANGITRIVVKMQGSYTDDHLPAPVRKVLTYYYVTYRGDRSYRWAEDAMHCIESCGVTLNPDLILGFYTPRGPLFLASHYARKLNVPWVADIQDPILSGISPGMSGQAISWMRKTLKTARSIFHISPASARHDAALLHMQITNLWHAVPEMVPDRPQDKEDSLLSDYKDCFNVFYGGSVTEAQQPFTQVNQVIARAAEKGLRIVVHLAGNKNAETIFSRNLGPDHFHYLGWLDTTTVHKYIMNCQCTMVIPFKTKIVVPSKLFELCAYPRPVWVIGEDSGSFADLMTDWGIEGYKVADAEYQTAAVLAAATGDFSKMLSLDRCTRPIVRASDLFDHYLNASR